MATLKKYNLSGKEIGTVQIDDELFNAQANGQMIKDYIVALRNNARQWSASTKTRAEVAHTTKKPHPQKGGGRARQGSLVSPQYRGGGRVFTPRPKFDQHVRINKKERKAAIRALLADKMRENRLLILDSFDLKAPKTKTVVDFLKSCNLEGRRVLFLGEGHYAEVKTGDETKKVSVHTDKHRHFTKSINNLQRVDFGLAVNASGYDMIIAHHIIMTPAALDEMIQLLK